MDTTGQKPHRTLPIALTIAHQATFRVLTKTSQSPPRMWKVPVGNSIHLPKEHAASQGRRKPIEPAHQLVPVATKVLSQVPSIAFTTRSVVATQIAMHGLQYVFSTTNDACVAVGARDTRTSLART